MKLTVVKETLSPINVDIVRPKFQTNNTPAPH
ncbi:hypothetical protein SAMN06266787_11720 [Halorubrum ezzemoulense]|uniref:Uncharacterized protein n=1 Tax=Halorubrum ezzemoulense TaxID=337243 RepID=A0A238YQR9_HALEZ|nr:hypothetical protein SAMN06266787_11720 [Halorubrum ezzemoulense]